MMTVDEELEACQPLIHDLTATLNWAQEQAESLLLGYLTDPHRWPERFQDPTRSDGVIWPHLEVL
jgi:hypothetical protein